MKRGDKVYLVGSNGELEIAEFLEEGISPGATIPTWKLQCEGRIFRCASTVWTITEREAWERYLADCHKALPDANKRASEAIAQVAYIYDEITKATKKLEEIHNGC